MTQARPKNKAKNRRTDHADHVEDISEKTKVIEEQPENEQASRDAQDTKVKIEFPYSEIVRAQIPKTFEVMEKVATDWKNEGDFHNLGLQSPLADAVAAQALKKAKEVEKKLEEKGVFSIAKMGLAIAKSQIDQLKKKL